MALPIPSVCLPVCMVCQCACSSRVLHQAWKVVVSKSCQAKDRVQMIGLLITYSCGRFSSEMSLWRTLQMDCGGQP